MAKRKRFNIHSLYPSGYCFDRAAFEADPEHYEFTADDTAYMNAMELERYEMETPMTPYEKRALRRCVISGQSIREAPPSRYACVYPEDPSPGFLDVYRTDKELDAATKGMSSEQRTAYLKEYIGHTDETGKEGTERTAREQLHRQTPKEARDKIRMLQRQLHYTWIYLAKEGIREEAEQFVKNHMDEPTPFEEEW